MSQSLTQEQQKLVEDNHHLKPTKYPDPDRMNAPYIECAECGGEVYEHGEMYVWHKKGLAGIEYETLICGECLMEHLREMSINEVAELIGSRKVVIK